MSDEFQRVKDKTTGHKFSVRHPNLSKVDVIDEPAVDREGKPLLAEPNPDAPATEFDDLRVDQLNARIAELNADRDDEHKIAPAGTKKADLIAALAGDIEANQTPAASTAAASTTTQGESA